MLKEILKKLGVDPAEDLSDEDAKRLIDEQIDAKNTQISELESEKDSLSKANEELTASVNGLKSSEEKLSKDLSDTQTELNVTKGKLEQVTDMYKEQFTKDPNQQEEIKANDIDPDDVLQQIIGMI